MNKIVIVYTGKLNTGKGLQYLLEAWTALVSSRPDVYLVLVGSGGGQALSCEDELRMMVEKLGIGGSILFTGYKEDVKVYLQAADIFVLPSENESLSISTIEAMACGIPVVACRVGGVPDVVDHMQNGVLIEPRNPSAIVEALEMLLRKRDLAESLARAGRATACERFSIRTISQRYFDLFSSIDSLRVQRHKIPSTGGAA